MTIIDKTKKRQQNAVDLKGRLSCSIDLIIIWSLSLSLSLVSHFCGVGKIIL